MRRLIGLILVMLLIALSACSNSQNTNLTTDSQKINTTTVSQDTNLTTTLAPTTTIESTTEATTTQKTDLTAAQLAEKLAGKGLSIADIVVYDESTDPNKLLGRPNQYTSKVNFSSTSDDKNSSSIEVFANEDDALARYNYVVAITSSSSMFAEYDFLAGKYFLRIDNSVLPSDSKKYESELKSLAGQ